VSCENIITYACKQKQPKTIQSLTKFTPLDQLEFDGLFNQKQQQNLHIALGIDTEFKPLTNQPAIPIGISIDNKWYEHPDCPTKQRPPFTQEVAIADHLGFTSNHGGGKWCTTHNSTLSRGEKYLVIWWIHYASPKDYSLAFKDHHNFWPKYGHNFKQQNHLTTKNDNKSDYIKTEIVFHTPELKRRLVIRPVDISKMQGQIKLKEFVENTGLACEAKDDYDWNKQDPLEEYKKDPNKFVNYATSDSKILCQATCKTINLIEGVFCDLGINKDHITVKPTAGSTVNRLILGGLAKKLPNWDSLTEKGQQNLLKWTDWKKRFPYTIPGEHNSSSVDLLKMLIDGNDESKLVPVNVRAQVDYCLKHPKTTYSYLGMVDGGRTKNERPQVPICHHKGALVDIDIKGCYANIISQLNYPIGVPVILDYEKIEIENTATDKSRRLTLDAFLKTYQAELVPGLWYARISTAEDSKTLSFCQDLIYSKFMNKTAGNPKPDKDTNNKGDFFLQLKQIEKGCLTHDLLQILKQCATAKEWSELRTKIKVDAAMFYPKSQHCQTFEQWAEEHDQTIENKRSIEGKKWLAIPIGEAWVNDLISLRQDYKKKGNDPAQKFVKLLLNTIYGSMASQHFNISNVIVANNITARARATIWLLAKSLGLFQTITDGGSFNAKAINTWKTKRPGLNSLTFINPENKNTLKTLSGKPPQFFRYLGIKSLNYQNGDYSSLASSALDHTCHFFRNLEIDILKHPQTGQPTFELEVETVKDVGIYQSQSNYAFGDQNQDGDLILDPDYLSQRGWTKQVYQDQECTIPIPDDQKPITHSMTLMANGQASIPAVYPTVYQQQICSLELWNQAKKKAAKEAEPQPLFSPGDTTTSTLTHNPFSLTAFRWYTRKNFTDWQKYLQGLAKRSKDTQLEKLATIFRDTPYHLGQLEWMNHQLEMVDYQSIINQFQTNKFYWDEEKDTCFCSPAKEKGNYK